MGGVTNNPIANIPTFDWIERSARCGYCKAPLTPVGEADHSEVSGGAGLTEREIRVMDCLKCGWWACQTYDRRAVGGYDQASFDTYQGAVYAFDLSDADLPLTALRREISKGRVDLASVSPTQLEMLVASVFRDFYACTVTHVGGPSDNGADVFLVQGAKHVIVQVKRRSDSSKTEGVKALRELLGTMLLEGHNQGIFVTTASEYSKPAKNLVVKAEEVAGMTLDLYNQERLRDVLALTERPTSPWDQVLAPWQLTMLRESKRAHHTSVKTMCRQGN